MGDETRVRRIEPLAEGWRSASFPGGTFDTGHRPYAEAVEGTILIPEHLVLVTLRGGARRVEIGMDCGHRHCGPDRAGAVSFVPAQRRRQLKMSGVSAAWASISLEPELFDEFAPDRQLTPFSNAEDPLLFGLVAEFERRLEIDGVLDPLYCETMSRALAAYLARRDARHVSAKHPSALPAWRVRRIADYVEAHLSEEILVQHLADAVGLSAGHLHRAFRATLGVTPLAYVNGKRIERAMAILAREEVGVAELALRVGFLSPSHFTRTFRRVAGINPSRFRADFQPML